MPLKPLSRMHAFRHHQELLQSSLDKEDIVLNEQFLLFHIPILSCSSINKVFRSNQIMSFTSVHSVTYVSLEKSEITYKAKDSLK